MYTVYKHTAPNDKIYIGITNQKPERRWRKGESYNHNLHFMRAIQKYGWENFKHEILFTGLTKEEAEKREVELIAFYHSNNPDFGYNIANGGNSIGKHSEETLRKMRLNRKDVSGSNNPMFGKKHSAESIKKMAEIKTGKHASLETRTKMSMARKGVKFSKEHKEKISKALCKKVLCVETNKTYDSVLQASEETNISKTCIASCCRGLYKTAGGFHWKYENMLNAL